MISDYSEKLKENQELKEKNEKLEKENKQLMEYNASLLERLGKSKEDCNTQFRKDIKTSKENEKLKIIITKLLEEKYCNEGE